jgi:hypothetical protein
MIFCLGINITLPIFVEKNRCLVIMSHLRPDKIVTTI